MLNDANNLLIPSHHSNFVNQKLTDCHSASLHTVSILICSTNLCRPHGPNDTGSSYSPPAQGSTRHSERLWWMVKPRLCCTQRPCHSSAFVSFLQRIILWAWNCRTMNIDELCGVEPVEPVEPVELMKLQFQPCNSVTQAKHKPSIALMSGQFEDLGDDGGWIIASTSGIKQNANLCRFDLKQESVIGRSHLQQALYGN